MYLPNVTSDGVDMYVLKVDLSIEFQVLMQKLTSSGNLTIYIHHSSPTLQTKPTPTNCTYMPPQRRNAAITIFLFHHHHPEVPNIPGCQVVIGTCSHKTIFLHFQRTHAHIWNARI